MDTPWYEYFDHAADVGIRVGAATRAGLYETAGRALMNWIGPAPRNAPEIRLAVEVEADGAEELLVRWLQELLFLFHARHAYFLRADKLEFAGCRMSATLAFAGWDEIDMGSYQEVKAVTYHQLSLKQTDAGWEASFILDL